MAAIHRLPFLLALLPPSLHAQIQKAHSAASSMRPFATPRGGLQTLARGLRLRRRASSISAKAQPAEMSRIPGFTASPGRLGLRVHMNGVRGLSVSARVGTTGVKQDQDVTLASFRQKLEKEALDAYIIPTSDPHQSEYPPNCFARREFISGFTGSAGTAVITSSSACLWTDGRYFLQAADELPESWKLQKAGLPDTPKISDWLKDNLKDGQKVGIDPFVHTVSEVAELESTLKTKGIELVKITKNLVDDIWDEQPSVPTISNGRG